MPMPATARTVLLCLVLLLSISIRPATAQLDQTFNDVFNYFLRDRLDRDDQVFHGQHYFPAADNAEQLLTPALNGLIASNISSFPLSSTIAGMSIDFMNGAAVVTNESLGPIFAETAESIGQGKINIGLSYSYMNLDRFRGLPIDQMRFTFAHQDVTPTPPFEEEQTLPGSLGAPAYELDNIDVFPNMDISSSIFAFTLSAGVLRNLDISLAIPIVNISMSGRATAVINSFTYGRLIPTRPEIQGAAHAFGGNQLNPILTADTTYNVSTNGVGDLAIRLKYVLPGANALKVALLGDIRLPTGDEHNFLGTGKQNIRFLFISSRRFNDFNPHINLGYDKRGGALDSDEVEYAIGFDHKVSNTLTFAADLLGSFDLQEDEAIVLFPGSIGIREQFEAGSLTRFFDLSNIPESRRDNTTDLAVGFRFAPSDKVVLMVNILTPLNKNGLRSDVIPTAGLSVSI